MVVISTEVERSLYIDGNAMYVSKSGSGTASEKNKRRDITIRAETKGLARMVRTALVSQCVFILALLSSCSITDNKGTAERPNDDLPGGTVTEVVVNSGKFDVDELLLPERQEARVIIINNDAVTYYFEIPLLLGQKRIAPHSTKALNIPARALVLANPPLREFEGRLLNAQLELIDAVEVTR